MKNLQKSGYTATIGGILRSLWSLRMTFFSNSELMLLGVFHFPLRVQVGGRRSVVGGRIFRGEDE